MMKRVFLSFFLLLSIGSFLSAQERTTLGISYQYALPMGDFKNVISKGSPRGLNVDLLFAVTPQWRVGGGVSFQDYYEKTPRNTYELTDGSHLSAVVSNSLQTTPLLVKGMYLPTGNAEGSLKPYFIAGAGINLIQYSELLGEFSSIEDANIRFAAQGGGGVLYTIGKQKRSAISLGAVYNYMPYNKYEITHVNNISLQLGARFSLRSDGRNRYGDWEEGDKRPPIRYRSYY